MTDLRVTRMLSAYYGWHCEHGRRRDEPCAECVASLEFDRKYRPKRYDERTAVSRVEPYYEGMAYKSAWRR